jgi:hypothetical protein
LVVLFEQTNEQLSQELQQRLQSYSKIAQPELIAFIEAVSRLVPLKDVDKEHSIGDRDKAVRDHLITLSTIFDKMHPDDLSRLRNVLLSNVSVTELRSFIPLSHYMRSNHLTSSQVVTLLSNERGGERSPGQMSELRKLFASMTPKQQASLLDAARSIQRPPCFEGAPAFLAVEVEGGYLVSEPIHDIAGAFSGAVSGLTRTGDAYFIPESLLDRFGSALTSTFQACYIRAREATHTNDERQYKHLNRYFYLSQ